METTNRKMDASTGLRIGFLPNDQKHIRNAGIPGVRSNRVIAGHRAIIVSSDQDAGTALADYGNVWVFTAKGPDARQQLEQLVSSVVLKH